MQHQRFWTEATVTAEILHCFCNAMDLSYTSIRKEYTALARAAERVFGSWPRAIEAAGLDYQSIRRYKIWNRDRILQQIQRWHAAGEELHWHYVSTVLDPALAAAVQHGRYIANWPEALRQAGLDPDVIARYRKWTPARVKDAFLAWGAQGIPLTQDALAVVDPALLAAVYRVMGGLTQLRASLTASSTLPSMFARAQTEDALDSLFARIADAITDVVNATAPVTHATPPRSLILVGDNE